MSYSNLYKSPLGDLLMRSEDGKNLSVLSFFDDNEVVEPQEDYNPLLPLFANVKRWLDIYFSGSNPPFLLPISLDGTALQEAVWDEVMQIPFGHRSTYNEIAARLSRRKTTACTARGVGGALNHNPIAIIVPCHRVLAENGRLANYRWGADRKQALLLHELTAGVETT